jgi:hypothetical protein
MAKLSIWVYHTEFGTGTTTIQQYNTSIDSRKGRQKRAGKLIYQVWLSVQQMWLGRNEVLHQKSIINQLLSGATLLDVEVEREFNQGYRDLPAVTYKWLNQSKEELLGKSVEYEKGWLLIVRTINGINADSRLQYFFQEGI